MSRHLHLTLDTSAQSTARAIAAAAHVSPLLILTGRALADLADELGSDDAAYLHLMRVSTNVNRPVGVNFTTEGGSKTCFIAPKDWTQERLAGWLAGKHEEITDAFGLTVPVLGDEL